jgi:hypothetical protein
MLSKRTQYLLTHVSQQLNLLSLQILLLHQQRQLLQLKLQRIKLNYLAQSLVQEGLRKRAFFIATSFHSFLAKYFYIFKLST